MEKASEITVESPPAEIEALTIGCERAMMRFQVEGGSAAEVCVFSPSPSAPRIMFRSGVFEGARAMFGISARKTQICCPS